MDHGFNLSTRFTIALWILVVFSCVLSVQEQEAMARMTQEEHKKAHEKAQHCRASLEGWQGWLWTPKKIVLAMQLVT